MLVAMVAGTTVVMFAGARGSTPHRGTQTPTRSPEQPWLTHEAAAQIIAPDGSLGPLFSGVELGAPVPATARARIAEFARKNHVTIDLETTDDQLAAVRFDVTFSGGVGYEGADVLALRLGRQSTGVCCVCGPDTWIDDWSVELEGGMHVRAAVRVNRVTARWEKTATLAELLDHAERLVGRPAESVRQEAGDRWIEVEPNHYLIEMPFNFRYGGSAIGYSQQLSHTHDYGIQVTVERDRIAEVSVTLHDQATELRTLLRSRWGRPAARRDDTSTWRTRAQTRTAELWDFDSTITIRARS